MKTKINHFSLRIRSLKLSAMLLLTFLTAGNTFSQYVNNDKGTPNEKDKTICKFEKFTAKQVEGKVYLNWTLISSDDDRFFVIERSKNGMDYKAIGMKKGAVSPNNIALLYSFIDEAPLTTTVYYRISLMESNGQIVASIKGENIYSLSNEIFPSDQLVKK